MQISINKTKLTAIIITVILMTSAFMLMPPQAQAVEYATPVSGSVPAGENLAYMLILQHTLTLDLTQ